MLLHSCQTCSCNWRAWYLLRQCMQAWQDDVGCKFVDCIFIFIFLVFMLLHVAGHLWDCWCKSCSKIWSHTCCRSSQHWDRNAWPCIPRYEYNPVIHSAASWLDWYTLLLPLLMNGSLCFPCSHSLHSLSAWTVIFHKTQECWVSHCPTGFLPNKQQTVRIFFHSALSHKMLHQQSSEAE